MRTSRYDIRGTVWAPTALALVVVVVAATLVSPATASAASGALVWTRGVELGPLNEGSRDLAEGPNGSVYAVGSAGCGTADCDVLVTKFSRSGKRLWAKRYYGMADAFDEAKAIAGSAAAAPTSQGAPRPSRRSTSAAPTP